VKRLLVLGLLLMAGVGARAATVTLSWNYDYTGLALCSATTTANCLDHFEMDDATSGKPALIATVANPANASGKVTGISGTFQTSLFGQRVLAVTAVGRDGSGNFVSSDWTKCQGTFQITPSAPGGLAGTVQ
jgi:hypothetical protein